MNESFSGLGDTSELKCRLFSEAVLDPFVRGFEQLGSDWLSHLDEPLSDQTMMEIFIRDIYGSLAANQRAPDQMLSGRAELPEARVERIQLAFEKLIGQLRLMTELEAHRRGWTSTLGSDMTVRIMLAMMMGMSAYNGRKPRSTRRHGQTRTVGRLPATAAVPAARSHSGR